MYQEYLKGIEVGRDRKFFAEVNRRMEPEHVKYDVVTSYGKLMEIVGMRKACN